MRANRSKMPSVNVYTVDAFTDKPLSGNPAAVILLDSDIGDELKQKLASEINLSETAFVTSQDSKGFRSGSKFFIRWFTPTNEVPLCGHGTLAASFVIFDQMENKNVCRKMVIKITQIFIYFVVLVLLVTIPN
uniref:Phenazine biosynthesis-like domain-containing protein n=1 Tax=Caligus rogercresseyi TaxID=217165 RepID=C1BPW9_CALRO|nr:Phenazine biosynthesis-like domain-containing protein [Caligus rogercresseyi]